MQQVLQAVPAAPINSNASIVACLGEAAAIYAQNKHRGGASGKKGTRYEDFFIAHKVAEIATSHFANPATHWPFLGGQTRGFVDDAVLISPQKTEYYQLKNVANISWTAGDHPISTDFHYQYTLATHERQVAPCATLVVSSTEQVAAMRASMPAQIAAYSSVVYFPYNDSLNRLVLENEALHGPLIALSKSSAPTKDELAGVLGVLIIGCMNNPEGASIDAILRSANGCVPSLLRVEDLIDERAALRAQFVSILAQIAGLSYDVSKGFFSWSAFGTSGVLPFSCRDPQFVQFQENVEQVAPTTFDGFEELLP
jgi:hypothetical protein